MPSLSFLQRAEFLYRDPPRPPRSFIGPIANLVRRARSRFAYRLGLLRQYDASPWRQPRVYFRFLFFDRELENFTYDLENEAALAAFVAEALDRPRTEIDAYLREVHDDIVLLNSLERRLRPSRIRNNVARFGRRLGWYCLARATKPRLAVETGTAEGLGTALLARALERNAEEGWPGRLVSFDLSPQAGWLLDDRVRGQVDLVLGDTALTLDQTLGQEEIDLFVHDSDHAYEHEAMELQFAVDHAGSRLLLVSDNAHATTALRDLCLDVGSDYRYFRERPRRHVYPGAGIGLTIIDQP
jgi:predicted O-methyltransferase YrrM